MTRLAIGVAIGLGAGMILGAALGIHAAGPQEDDDGAPATALVIPTPTVQAAEQAGVDPHDLQGAVATTGLDPYEYLYRTGELLRPPPPTPAPFGAVARADCIIAKESGGLDVRNRSGSPATGPGQYFPGTWTAHVALYRAATGYRGPLDLHSLQDVRRVMAYVLTLPGQRAHWVVGGC